jgi:hypothetical protein
MKRPENYTHKKKETKKNESQEKTNGAKPSENEESKTDSKNATKSTAEQPPLDLLDFDLGSYTQPEKPAKNVAQSMTPQPAGASSANAEDDLLSIALPVAPKQSSPLFQQFPSNGPNVSGPPKVTISANQKFAFDFNSVQKTEKKKEEENQDPFDLLEAEAKKNLKTQENNEEELFE